MAPQNDQACDEGDEPDGGTRLLGAMPFVSVSVRVKPALSGAKAIAWVSSDDNRSSSKVYFNRDVSVEEYEFSHAFRPEDDNRQVFAELQGHTVAQSVCHGMNETLFAYGQTGSGKTHTIFGTRDEPGLLQYFVHELFACASQSPQRSIHVCCYEVFGDVLTDLVDTAALVERGELRAADVVQDELFLKTQKYRYQIACVGSASTCLELLRNAQQHRTSGISSCNTRSSRSHAIVHIFVKSAASNTSGDSSGGKVGALTLVDLAGAEKENDNPSEHGRKSTRLLNASLSTLNRLLRRLQTNSLNESERRQSVLNKCLWEYLRPGCGIALIFCVSPLLKHRLVTQSTLGMAMDCKLIRNRRIVQHVCAPQGSESTEHSELDAETLRSSASSSYLSIGCGSSGSLTPSATVSQRSLSQSRLRTARSQERLRIAEQDRSQLKVENELLRRQCEQLRSVCIRQQKEKLDFWAEHSGLLGNHCGYNIAGEVEVATAAKAGEHDHLTSLRHQRDYWRECFLRSPAFAARIDLSQGNDDLKQGKMHLESDSFQLTGEIRSISKGSTTASDGSEIAQIGVQRVKGADLERCMDEAT